MASAAPPIPASMLGAAPASVPSLDASVPLPMLDLGHSTPSAVTTTELPVVQATSSVAAPVGPPAPGLITGPAAVLSLDPAFMPLEHSLPSLPSVAATPPPNTAAAALGAAGKSPLSLDDFDFSSPQVAKGKKGQGGARRAFSRLVLVGVLGAGGYFGYTKGPSLYDQYVTKSGDSAAGEADAPLTFPTSPAIPMPVRTAEFMLSGLAGSPDTEYAVTIDFETNVSRVEVTRGQGPDLEVLTFGDAAVVRRVGEAQWYQVERGTFPLDDQLERADWVRTLDELLPPDRRSAVVIDRSTESTIANVPARHLLVTVDPAMLSDANLPMPTLDPVTGLPVVQPLAADPLTTATLPVAGSPAVSTPSAVGVTGAPTVQIEIWVDSNGLVRQITGAPQLGADKITVLTTSDQAFIPEFPPQEQVLPLTASALVELGM
jgi:hypothetical protein